MNDKLSRLISLVPHFQGKILINKITFDLSQNLQEKEKYYVRDFQRNGEFDWSKCTEES